MRRRRILSTLAPAALALALGSQAVLGAVPIAQKGKIGQYTIRDTEDQPGVVCTYDAGAGSGNDLDIMEAKGPRVFARDRSNARDAQRVGVKVIFQRSVNEGGTGGWVKAKATKLVKKTAYDDQPAVFAKKAWLVPIEEDYHFRALTVIKWFKPGTSSVVQGSAKLRYQWYKIINFGTLPAEQDRCLPEP